MTKISPPSPTRFWQNKTPPGDVSATATADTTSSGKQRIKPPSDTMKSKPRGSPFAPAKSRDFIARHNPLPKPRPTLADYQGKKAAGLGQIRRLGRGQAQRAPAQVRLSASRNCWATSSLLNLHKCLKRGPHAGSPRGVQEFRTNKT